MQLPYSPSSPSIAEAPCAVAPILDLRDPNVAQLLMPWVTPPTFPDSLLRSRLLDQLAPALMYPLTIVAAPPGAGKTVLLSQWMRRLRSRADAPRTAWLTIAPGLHEPLALAQALQFALLHAGALFEPLVPAPAEPLAAEMVLVHLHLHAFSTPTALVIDGVERLGDRAQAWLTQLAEHAPPTLRLVLAGRSEPQIPLPRLRLQGVVFDLRDADLRWDTPEAAALLRDVLQLSVRTADVAALVQRSAGWVTGLCLAGVALRAQEAPESLATFSGADHAVVEYVAGEVLAPHPSIVRTFLFRSAMLPELTLRAGERILRALPLDGDGSGLQSPQAMFAYLERHNLFVEPLDRQRTRYRLNPLIAEALEVLNNRHAAEAPPKPPLSGVALSRPESSAAPDEPWLITEALSEREQQILRLAAGGLPNREIAQQLWISEATVKSHLKRIFGKLGARNRTEAVAIARKRQLMSVV